MNGVQWTAIARASRLRCVAEETFETDMTHSKTHADLVRALFKRHRQPLIWTALLSALSSGISIALLAGINGAIAAPDNVHLGQALGAFFGLIAALFVLSFVSQYQLARIGSSFVHDLRGLLLQQATRVSHHHLEQLGGHRVLATLTTDVSHIAMALMILPVFAVNIATVLFCFAYLCVLSPGMFAVLLGGLLTGLGASMLIMRFGRRKFIELREQEDELHNVFKTAVDGSKELNINQQRRGFFLNALARPSVETVRQTEVQAKGYWVLSDSLMRAVVFLVLGAVFYLGYFHWHSETRVLTAFVLFTTYIIGPMGFIQSTFQALVKGKVAYDKIQALKLTQDDGSTRWDDDRARRPDWQTLHFHDVSYRYPGDGHYRFGLGPINLTIRRGDAVFICGGNGSGKSTFAKVLVGLYPADAGRIELDGEAIDAANRQWYRNHFSTIFSDFYLFDHVLDAQGQPVEGADVAADLASLRLQDIVQIEADGRIGSTRLSQGQRKRLAMLIARSEDAPIYLFDEWAADQDPEYRAYFYRDLLPELKARGKTLIVITHDDRYFHHADVLLKFDNGQIVPANEAMEQGA